jgi:hypothetical protein
MLENRPDFRFRDALIAFNISLDFLCEISSFYFIPLLTRIFHNHIELFGCWFIEGRVKSYHVLTVDGG